MKIIFKFENTVKFTFIYSRIEVNNDDNCIKRIISVFMHIFDEIIYRFVLPDNWWPRKFYVIDKAGDRKVDSSLD